MGFPYIRFDHVDCHVTVSNLLCIWWELQFVCPSCTVPNFTPIGLNLTSSSARFSYCGYGFTSYGNPVYVIEVTKLSSTVHGVESRVQLL